MHVLFTYLEDVIWTHPGHNLFAEVCDTSASLNHLGVRVTVLTAGPGERDPKGQSHNPAHLLAPLLRVIPMTRLDEMRVEALLQSNLSLLARMIPLQSGGEKIDLVHCFGWEAGLASGLICQMLGAPLVCTIQDVIEDRSPWLVDPQLAYPRYVTRWLIRHSRRLICPDQHARDKIQDLFLVEDEDLVILSPLPPRAHTAVEREVPLQEAEPKVLYVGPLGPESGVEELLWACSQLISRRALDLQLFLATSAASSEDLPVRKMARKLQMAEHVQFLDHIGPGGPPEDLFRKANLLVMPGLVEFVGNLVFHAMAYGIPVVAADGGALAQVIENGVNGLKYPYGQGPSLVEAMETILFDTDLYRQMAQGARREVRRRPQVGPLLVNIYREVCRLPSAKDERG